MKTIKDISSLFVIVLIASAFSCGKYSEAPQTSEIQEIYDGFEGKGLSEVWSSEKLESGAVEIQSEIVRAGHGAAKITIRQGDRFEKADAPGRDNDTERDELLERKDLYSREGRGYYYSFSIFIPRDFPVVPTRLVLAQWKQKEVGSGAIVNNPLIAVRYAGGQLSFTSQTTREKVTLYKTKDDVQGKWLDFVFWIRFDRTKDGFIRGWLNGSEIINYHGTTAYTEEYGYEKDGHFYFKIGLYRDRMAEPMTAYFDEYRKYPLLENEEECDECEGCEDVDLETVE